MREGATLKLDSGAEIRVAVDPDELADDEIVVRRYEIEHTPSQSRLLATIDRILATGKPHSAGTTDRWLAADRNR